MKTLRRWIKNRPSIILNEHDLQTIIHYVEIGDRAIIELSQGKANGSIKGIFPKGLSIRVWDGEIGTTKFFKWSNIIEIKKSNIKRKNTFLKNVWQKIIKLLITKKVG